VWSNEIWYTIPPSSLLFKIVLLLHMTCTDKIQQVLRLCINHSASFLSHLINGIKFEIVTEFSHSGVACPAVV
jgi:hypothetical protein